jgi:glycosyltransferase involved in cell wall biosynthesis
MKIVIISSVFPPEPVVSAKLSFDIASELFLKTKVSVLSPKPTRPYGFKFNDSTLKFEFENIKTNSYTCPKYSLIGRLRENFSFGRHCYKYIIDNNRNLNLIYSNVWPLISQFFVIKAAKKFNIPVIVHVQDVYPESLMNKLPLISFLLKSLFLPVDKYILHNSKNIIAISDTMKDYLVKTRGLNIESIIVAHNWQDGDVFIHYKKNIKSCKSNNDPFTFMYLGNIGPVAGVDLLIDSFEKAKLSNCRLVIAGSGSMKNSLEKKARRIQNSSIEFWTVQEGKVPEIQDLADVLILPLKKSAASSSIPSKLSAYMFSGKPIIASVDRDSDTANIIKRSNCGWVIPPENKDLLSEIMKTVVYIPEDELHNLGLNGYNYSLEYFSKSINLQKIISVITR